MHKKIVVAVDGTAGSGKTHTFKEIAKQVGYEFIDTGLMYRAFTLLCIKNNIEFKDPEQIVALIPAFNYEVINHIPYLNGQDVEIRIQASDIIDKINYISTNPTIRTFMVNAQRAMVHGGGYIEIGRDITSVVLPDADLKIYLDCSVSVRAQRRYAQNQANHITDKSLIEIEAEIKERDAQDQSNVLKRVPDAWYIDNSDLPIPTVVSMVVDKIKELEVN